jgi:hypothetical protein
VRWRAKKVRAAVGSQPARFRRIEIVSTALSGSYFGNFSSIVKRLHPFERPIFQHCNSAIRFLVTDRTADDFTELDEHRKPYTMHRTASDGFQVQVVGN